MSDESHSTHLARSPDILRRPTWEALSKRGPATQWGPGFLRHASWTPEGPATISFDAVQMKDGERIHVTTFGPGGQWALTHAEDLLGHPDDGTWATGTALEKARRRHGPMRVPTMFSVADAALRIVLGQRVTTLEAKRSYHGLVAAYGEDAPGPFAMRLPPRGRTLAALPYYELHRFGIERRRAQTVQLVGKRAVYLERCRDLPAQEARTLLAKLPGIGPWTIGNMLSQLGDPDAVPVGDYHLPNTVSWALAGEERGDDRRMLELLEPYRGHRQYALKLIHRVSDHAPRKGPKQAPSKWTQDKRF